LKTARLFPCPTFVLSLALTLAGGAAWAQDSVCWIQNGVLLVPAVAAGIDGVFILDTGQAQSQIDATQASEVGLGDPAATAEVRVAGRVFKAVMMAVAPLDERTRAFPTPISGVLGADVLAGQVLSVRPYPCRLSLTPTRAGAGRGETITLRQGVPYVHATASNGQRATASDFRIDTGSPAPVALDPASGLASGGRLRALSIGGRLFENLIAVPHVGTSEAALGAIGEPVWSRHEMRLDFGNRTLALTPAP
jgi:hypothetical protein